jgi:hypothetical protein
MTKLKAVWKQASWVLWALVALTFAVVVWTLRGLFHGPANVGPTRLPLVPEKLQAKVDKAEEEALKAKVEATVKAEEAKHALEEIGKIPDGAERRRRLAERLKPR